MKDERRNAWKRQNGIDSLFNGGIIGVVIAGLLLAVLDGPLPLTAHDVKPAGNGSVEILGTRA